MDQDSLRSANNRKLVGVSINLVIAVLHIIGIGRYLNGDLQLYYSSYFSDLVLPFGNYFLLCIVQDRVRLLRSWLGKALFMIGLTTLAEVLQAFGIYALGTTFDPIDILCYILGAGFAALVERQVFRRFIRHWDF